MEIYIYTNFKGTSNMAVLRLQQASIFSNMTSELSTKV